MMMQSKVMGGSTLKIGLSSLWELNSSVSAIDEVGGNNGTYTLIPFFPIGILGNCIQRTAYNQAISIPNNTNNSLTPNGAFSFSQWVKSSNWARGGSLVQKRNNTNLGEYQINFYGGNLNITIGDGITLFTKYIYAFIPLSSLGLVNNQWTHFAITWNGINQFGFKIYVNSVNIPIPSGNCSNGGGWTICVNSETNLLIGTDLSAFSYFDYTDQSMIYKKELLQAEITSIYNSGAGLPYTNF